MPPGSQTCPASVARHRVAWDVPDTPCMSSRHRPGADLLIHNRIYRSPRSIQNNDTKQIGRLDLHLDLFIFSWILDTPPKWASHLDPSKMMSSNVAFLHSGNCCVVRKPAICEDLDIHVAIFVNERFIEFYLIFFPIRDYCKLCNTIVFMLEQ